MLRCIIADDEKPARSRMKKLLSKYSDKIKIIAEAVDGIDAIEKAEDFVPDFIFLDIEMPGLNGIEVANQLNPMISPIFVTAYDEYAIQAFETNAIDYLVKPVNELRLAKTIEKIYKQKNQNQNLPPNLLSSLHAHHLPKRIAFKVGSKYEIFNSENISFIQSKDQYSSCMVEEKEVLSDDTLEQILARLNPEIFIKVHRSYIINLNYLKELKREGDRKYVAILSNFHQTEIPISREKLNELKKVLGMK